MSPLRIQQLSRNLFKLCRVLFSGDPVPTSADNS
ncbi:LEPR-XLL domain-containing protein [Rheinheimera tangshanensis]|uniref:LEPR-XLL domain-containing protein n=1 Tax=Rheinheimera tangshanensis TaxID=400153 RepID=A0A5C8LWG1_9GAMM|nr:LEPR-XLL domain-containing protein [Rheinheimera tangshanensis]